MDFASLRRRREHLQLRLKRQADSAQARDLARRLHAAGIRRMSRLPAARAREALAPFAALPERDERFFWPDISLHQRSTWDGERERDGAFSTAIRECFCAEQRLVLVFHPWQSALVVSAADLLGRRALLLEHLYETLWVVPLNGPPALVEVSVSDQEVCWLLPR
jgi:hypothetical protein